MIVPKNKWLVYVFLTLLVSCSPEEKQVPYQNILWYDEPASDWMEALPVGNGRLGAMVFGNTITERIQLNEDSMWSGGPDWGDSKGNPDDLAMIRNLIFEGKVHEADSLLVERFSYKSVKRSHQTMGDLYIDFEEKPIATYRRELNLDEGLASVLYVSENETITEKVFASNPDQALLIELKTTDNSGMDFALRLDRPEDNGHKTVTVTEVGNDGLLMEGMVTQYGGRRDSKSFPLDYGVAFHTRLKVKNTGGTIRAENGRLLLKGVQHAVIYLVCETSFYDENFEQTAHDRMRAVSQQSFEDLLDRHREDHSELYGRVILNLGDRALDSIPTDERLTRMKSGKVDKNMIEKLFQFGRYLLIGSSRPGTNPANLQGLWNEHIEAPWNADYHLNINLQMNYWPAEPTNLASLHEPLFDFIDRLIVRGRITAREQYGCGGSVIHHATDLWAPPWMRAATAYWGSWVHGGGWIVRHYWEAYLFNREEVFLRERAYPAMKEIATFYLDWLVRDPQDNTWISNPSTSPENSYIASDGKPAASSKGDAMSHQIIADLFDNVITAAAILDIEDAFVARIKEKRSTLKPGLQLGEDGRLLEWDQPYEEAERGHRHMSHLYALHPSDDITSAKPEYMKAAQKTIDYRLEHGGAATGWSRAWMVNICARLMNDEALWEHLTTFFEVSTANNLFDMHPPFQIDGNFGVTAGIAEMLVQSHEGFIRLLPALPAQLASGEVTGLKTREGYEISMTWKEGKLETLTLLSLRGNKCKVVYDSKEKMINLPKGDSLVLNGELETM